MQVLWSRATQTRSSCRCSSCLHAATALARRTTTAASKRRLRVGDVFTACYSAMLATAAFADAKVKEDRRKEWDRVIAEARTGTPVNELDPIDRICPHSEIAPIGSASPPLEYIAEDCGVKRTMQKTTPVWNGKRWVIPLPKPQTSIEARLRMIGSQLKQPLASSAEVSREQELDTPGADCDDGWMELPDAQLTDREPRKQVHLDYMELMVANLVDCFLPKANLSPIQDSTSGLDGSAILLQMRGMAQRIEQFKMGFTRLPAYSWDDLDSVKEQRYALHSSLYQLCRKTAMNEASINLMLAKVCYNLLVSTVPPSITTYNILLNEFNRLERPDLAQFVVDSFLYESRFRPNTKTVKLILEHYTIKKDPWGFHAIVQRMRGVGDGIRVNRRAIALLSSPLVQEWALTNKISYQEKKFLVQKMPRDSGIFDALIQGRLRFRPDNVRSAIRYARAALREGHQISKETLCRVMAACLKQLDIPAAASLLRAILSQWQQDSDFSRVEYDGNTRCLIYHLLDLCGVDRSPNPRLDLPFRLPREALQNMLRYMYITSLGEAIGRVWQRLLDVEKSLSYFVSQSPSSSSLAIGHLTDALHSLEVASSIDQRFEDKRRQGKASSRWRRFKALGHMLDVDGLRITAKQWQLLPIVYHSLPQEQQAEADQYLKFSSQMHVAHKLEVLMSLKRTEHQLCQSETQLKSLKLKSEELQQQGSTADFQEERPATRSSTKLSPPLNLPAPEFLPPILPVVPLDDKIALRATAGSL